WGTYTLRGTFEPPPANDAFANRAVLTNTPSFLQSGATSVNAYNVSATKETGEPWHGGATYAVGGKSVWWTWTAPASGWATVTVSPVHYTFDSLVGVYTGNAVASLTRITNAYTTCTDGHTVVDFPVTVGTAYQMAADGGGTHGDSGEFTFNLSVRLDTNAPAVTVTNPLPGQSCTSPAITVSGTASDLAGTGAFRLASGVNLVEVRLNGGVWLAATGTNAWSWAVTLSLGANLIEARARDAAGNYSSLAALTVTHGTILSQVRMSAGVPEFTFPTESSKTYQLEWVGSLLSPLNWEPVDGASVPGTGSPATCTDTNCAGQPQRFYRLKAVGN
ncbi:MAG: Ig-like domain-containing protein, partial [Verrucomicrobia bacterium]|nr:Ig-like domain-containing protein [Verrucomicrobiota bacterium]